MKANYFMIGLIAVLVNVFLSAAVFASTYDFQVSPSIVSVCPCSAVTPQNVRVSVKNLYQYPDTFSFVVDAPSGMNVQIQQNLIVNPGETKSLDLFLINTACTIQPGSYTVTIKAKSGTTGETQTKTLDLEALNCYEVQLSIDSKFKEMCTEENKSVVFYMVIENKGKYSDTYDLKASAPWAVFSDKTVTIDAGKSKTVGLAITPPEGALGIQNVNVEANSQKFYSKDTDTVQVNVEDCYQMSAELQPSEVRVCLGEIVTQNLIISNLGLRSDTYTIIVPNWVNSDRTSVTLDPKKTAEINLSVQPAQKGRTYFNVTIVSPKDPAIAKSLPSIADVEECRGVAVIASPSQSRICQGVDSEFLVSVKNLGKIQDTFSVNSTIGVLEFNKVVLAPGETKEFALTISNVTNPGTYKVTVTTYAGEVSDEASVDLVVEDCYSASIDLSPQKYSTCFGSQVNYTVVLKNTGKLADDYLVSLQSEFYNTTRAVHLQPGETKPESFTLPVPSQPEAKDYEIKVTAKSEHVTLNSATTLTVKSASQCYSVQLCTNQENLVALCNATTMPITVKNTGEKKATYTLSFDGPQWVYLNPNSAELAAGEQKDVYLYISPCFGIDKDVYPVKIKAASQFAQSQVEVAIGVVPNMTGITKPPAQSTCNVTGNVTPPTPPGNVTPPVIPGGNITGLILGLDANTWKIVAIAAITLIIILILVIRFIMFAK